jgi:hypothetical protein
MPGISASRRLASQPRCRAMMLLSMDAISAPMAPYCRASISRMPRTAVETRLSAPPVIIRSNSAVPLRPLADTIPCSAKCPRRGIAQHRALAHQQLPGPGRINEIDASKMVNGRIENPIDCAITKQELSRPCIRSCGKESSAAINKAGWDKSIATIVLTGAGEKTFCTGGYQSAHDGGYDGRGRRHGGAHRRGGSPHPSHVDKGYRGHNHPHRLRVWISRQVRRVTASRLPPVAR